MNEAEWLACADPMPMLERLRGSASDRKLKLFAVACCRRIDLLVVEDESRSAIDLCEVASDHEVPEQQRMLAYWRSHGPVVEFAARQERVLSEAAAAAERCIEGGLEAGEILANVTTVAKRAANAETLARREGGYVGLSADGLEPLEWQARLVRCLFGPLGFRQLGLDPSWLTSDVLALSQCIYDERTFDQLPILADALTDAGCGDEDILNHLRSDGPHVRGCWVIDLLLGKS